MKKISMLLMGLACFLVILGCATIVTGDKQTVTIDSSPQGAEVLTNGRSLGQTPLTIPLERKKDGYVLVMKKDGYKDNQMHIESSINKWILGDLLFWVGFIVDFVTDAAWELKPGYVNLKLEPEK